jgi:hypothetical protein
MCYPKIKENESMPSVVVVPTGKGKFKVLVNFIQRGCDYSSQEQAELEAQKVRTELEGFYKQ